MKMVYERPVMKAEVYATNAYCNACGTRLSDTLVTDKDHVYGNVYGAEWKPGAGITADMLGHTFDNDSIYAYTQGNCTGGHTTEEKQQAIWECTCENHGDTKWYLEYSHYYSEHVNGGKDTFCLYMDDGDGKFEIIKNHNDFPYKETNSDTNAGVVIYSIQENVVSNS